jgi:transposase
VVMPNQDAASFDTAGAGATGGRRPTVVLAPATANPELSGRPKRRSFTAQEKLRILQQAERAAGSGEIGALLRRNGLYSSALTEWRRQRDAGALGALTPSRRGPKPAEPRPLTDELAKSQQENVRLRLRLERAEAIIDLQKKVSDLLGIALPPAERDGKP